MKAALDGRCKGRTLHALKSQYRSNKEAGVESAEAYTEQMTDDLQAAVMGTFQV